MLIEVHRVWETNRSVCGQMSLNGVFECFTLEPARLTPVHPGHPCILAGTYRAVLTMSPHLGYITPLLLDVPGRSEIRVHCGNKPEDVLGCTAVGQTHTTDWVGVSRVAFENLMQKLQGQEDITVAYYDPN